MSAAYVGSQWMFEQFRRCSFSYPAFRAICYSFPSPIIDHPRHGWGYLVILGTSSTGQYVPAFRKRGNLQLFVKSIWWSWYRRYNEKQQQHQHEPDGQRPEVSEIPFVGRKKVFVGGTAGRRGQRAEVSFPPLKHYFPGLLGDRHDIIFI